MKKYIYCALIALIALSCSKDEEPSMDKPFVAPKTLNAQTPKFESRAIVEYQPESWGESETVNSRTYATLDESTKDYQNPEYIQYWSEGNAISVFFTEDNLKYELQNYEENNDVGIFEFVDENISGGRDLRPIYYYSVYPYKEDNQIFWRDGRITYNFSDLQHYSGDSYANDENGMIAREPKETTDNVLYFQNFCSYLQLRLVTNESNSKPVSKISLISNNLNDKISGSGEISFDDNNNPVVSMISGNVTSNKITLDCNNIELSKDPQNPSKFWFVIPGGFEFSEGFTICVTFADNTYFKQSTKKNIGIDRSHIKPMATLNPTSTTPDGPIRYKYNDTSINTPYPLNCTFLDEDNLPLEIVDQIYDDDTDEWVVLLSGTLKTIYDNSFSESGPDINYIKINNGVNPIVLRGYSFFNCTADELIIENDVLEINGDAFSGSTITNLTINGDVTTIKENAGSGSSIANLVINGTVTNIEQNAFNACLNLVTVDVNNIETIGYRAFYSCTQLTTVNIPGVKTLGIGAFRSCKLLEEITLTDIRTIGDNAFMDCSRLTSVIIGASCTSIGEGAFCNDAGLQTVECWAINPPFISTDNTDKSFVFENTNNVPIQIPVDSWDAYNNANYFDDKKNWWTEYYRRIYDVL